MKGGDRQLQEGTDSYRRGQTATGGDRQRQEGTDSDRRGQTATGGDRQQQKRTDSDRRGQTGTEVCDSSPRPPVGPGVVALDGGQHDVVLADLQVAAHHPQEAPEADDGRPDVLVQHFGDRAPLVQVRVVVLTAVQETGAGRVRREE